MDSGPGGQGEAGDDRASGSVVVDQTVVVVDGRAMARRFWGVLVAVGVVAVVFGVVVLANLWDSARVVAVLAGLFFIFAGVMNLFVAPGGRHAGRIVSGVLAIIAGLVLVLLPDESVKVVAVIVGASFLIWGVALLVVAIAERGEGWGITAAFSALLAVIGLIVIARPGPTVAILMILVGLNAIVFGISTIAQGLTLRKA